MTRCRSQHRNVTGEDAITEYHEIMTPQKHGIMHRITKETELQNKFQLYSSQTKYALCENFRV